jgi:molybdopterin converting factor small subunit
MRIHLKIRGLPQLYKVMNKKKDVDLEFSGSTVGDAVSGLVSKYGPVVKKALVDQNGDIDMELRVVLNDRTFLMHGERMSTTLQEGDTLWLMTVG